MGKSKAYFKTCSDFQKAVHDEQKEFIYARGAEPSIVQLCKKIASKDQKEEALAFASGVGAISATLFSLLKSGDHVLYTPQIYSWSSHLIHTHLKKFDIHCEELNFDPSQLRPNTRMIFLELPTYYYFQMPNWKALVNEAKKRNIIVILDNTYAGPDNFIHANEFDLIVYSATKSIVGNGDDLGGFVSGSSDLISMIFRDGLMSLGSVLSHRAVSSFENGLTSLDARRKKENEKMKDLLKELTTYKKIEQIFSPWVQNNKYTENKDFKYISGLFSIRLKDKSESFVSQLCDSFKHIRMGVSYGCPESLAMPKVAFHKKYPLPAELIGDIRLWLGYDTDVADFLSDLKILKD